MELVQDKMGKDEKETNNTLNSLSIERNRRNEQKLKECMAKGSILFVL